MGTRWTVRAAVAACILLLPVSGWAQDERARVDLSLGAPTERRLTSEEHRGHLFRERAANFSLAGITYTIAWKACVDPAHGGQVAPIEGYIGMPRPCSCNWYHSGFLFIRLNGRDIGTTPLSSMTAVERGERAILDLVWHDEAANVRARFVGLPAHDCLLCEVAIEPVQAITSVGIELRCYPSFFTSWHKRDGARRIRTPSQLVEQGPTVRGPLADNWWAVYYDEVFDVAKGEGEGPCSMLVLPTEGAEVLFAPGDYAVTTTLSFPPDTRRVRMAFWDHKGMTNAAAVEHVAGQAEAVRALLQSSDFTPAAVAGFDAEAAREQVLAALASEAARAALAQQIEQMQSWLEAYGPARGAEAGELGVAAEEELLRMVDTYNSFKWELKLIELLTDL
ncbi:MAG: hypothetical protein AB7Y46_04440 [Armatimonadota bacterium]